METDQTMFETVPNLVEIPNVRIGDGTSLELPFEFVSISEAIQSNQKLAHTTSVNTESENTQKQANSPTLQNAFIAGLLID